MRGSLLMTDQDVADGELAQHVIDRQNRSAGVAEDRGYAAGQQALHHRPRPDAWRHGRQRRLRLGIGEAECAHEVACIW
ncbi:MAG TPA: hypothetical protein VK838_01265, partial [Candidatus Limnocylindrales bacterium]|nr:hypothetical protein [Candidatus Limnocylindrales bacterium]